MRRPRIGITRNSRPDDYVESIRKAGGEPVLLDNSVAPADAIDQIDGLVLTGGIDVDPARYGEARHPTTDVDEARDAFEFDVTGRALARDMPVLAICRGMQLVNVAAGGDLVQDIPSQLPGARAHSVVTPKDAIAHSVRIEPGSLLSRMVSETDVGDTCDVNSRHHQAVRRVAPGFTVSATSPDGIVEAIERPQARFCLAVQWHPENFHNTGQFARLFQAFIDACRQR